MFMDCDRMPVVQPVLDNGAIASPLQVAFSPVVGVQNSDDDITYANDDFMVDELLSINHSRLMDASIAITIMSALAQPTRLRTFQLLVEHGEDGLASGAIASAVGAPQNTMSSHLMILTHAKLVEREQKGRTVTYRAVLHDVQALGAYLTG